MSLFEPATAAPSAPPGPAPMAAEEVWEGPPVALCEPERLASPVIFASPHSGRRYPDAFLAASRLDPLSLRLSEDAFVDELFAAAPTHGAPLIAALFPRAWLDVNREAWELDRAMFEGALGRADDGASPRVAGGLGVIPRIVADGREIYRRKLPAGEAAARLAACHEPYHAALRAQIARAREAFGLAIVIDCHSMPSEPGPADRDAGRRRADIVLGDRYGAACAPSVSQAVEAAFRARGRRVARNAPYAGGYTTAHYGRPRQGVHALQIEIKRGLYMDEARVAKGPGFAALADDVAAVVAELAMADWRDLAGCRA